MLTACSWAENRYVCSDSFGGNAIFAIKWNVLFYNMNTTNKIISVKDKSKTFI